MAKASVRGLILVLAVCFLSISPGVVRGQPPSQKDRLPEELKRGLAKTVTLDADDAFLPSILTILAEKSGFNIVTGPGVNTRERISVHLKDTPIEEAINLVVRAAGLSYEIVGNSFLVAEAEALEQEIGISSHVIDLQYANANEMKELLQDLTERIQIDTSGNRILVTASPKVIADIKNIIQSVDTPARQVLLEARLIEVATDDLDRFGIDWEKLSRLTTILAESPLVRDDFTGATDGSSRPPNETDFGGEYPDLDELPEKYKFEKIEGFDNVFQFSRQLNAFDITLDFLIKRNKAKVLAHAQLTTMNNREATILIGETMIFAVTSRENAIVIRDSIGIKLHITPTINADDFITVKVIPEVSSIIELVLDLYPRKKIRTASTTVLVKDGQKIFIGGLFSIDDSEIEFRMPLFSNLPLIGNLFKHSYYATKKTDLIIEVTPHIVRQDVSYSDAANLTSNGYRILDDGVITDLESLEPGIKELKEYKSDVEELKKNQEEMTTPPEKGLEER